MAVKWKIPDPLGFAALIESLKKTKKASDAAVSGVSGLQEDVQGLADRTTAGFQQANTALQTLDSGKAGKDHTHTADDVGAAKKPLSGSVTIPITGWGSDSTATYPKYYDIATTGVTASDRASIDIATASMGTAVACGLCPATETLAGKIRIRAASVPTAALTANYWVEKGA